jgi:hypothetical protein
MGRIVRLLTLGKVVEAAVLVAAVRLQVQVLTAPYMETLALPTLALVVAQVEAEVLVAEMKAIMALEQVVLVE